jgi:hypothetical protein
MKKVAFLVECLVLLCLLEVGIRTAVPPQIDVPHLRVFAGGFYPWYPGSRFTYQRHPRARRLPADGYGARAEGGAPQPGVLARAIAGDALVRALVAELIASSNRIGAPVVLLTIPSPLYLSGGDATTTPSSRTPCSASLTIVASPSTWRSTGT